MKCHVFFRIRAAMAKDMLKVLEDIMQNQFKRPPVCQHIDALQEGSKPKQYQPLLSRIKCGNFEIIPDL